MYVRVFPLIYGYKSVWLNVCLCVCVCVCVCMYVCWSRARGERGCPSGVSTHTVSKPIWACWQQEHDCPSLWPHAQCQLCSAGMEGWRPEKEILGQLVGDEKSRIGNQWREKGKKERVYAGVENEEGQRAYRIQMRQRIEWWRSRGATAE